MNRKEYYEKRRELRIICSCISTPSTLKPSNSMDGDIPAQNAWNRLFSVMYDDPLWDTLDRRQNIWSWNISPQCKTKDLVRSAMRCNTSNLRNSYPYWGRSR